MHYHNVTQYYCSDYYSTNVIWLPNMVPSLLSPSNPQLPFTEMQPIQAPKSWVSESNRKRQQHLRERKREPATTTAVVSLFHFHCSWKMRTASMPGLPTMSRCLINSWGHLNEKVLPLLLHHLLWAQSQLPLPSMVSWEKKRERMENPKHTINPTREQHHWVQRTEVTIT